MLKSGSPSSIWVNRARADGGSPFSTTSPVGSIVARVDRQQTDAVEGHRTSQDAGRIERELTDVAASVNEADQVLSQALG